MVENKKSDIDLTKDFIRDYELFSNEIKNEFEHIDVLVNCAGINIENRDLLLQTSALSLET